MRRPSIRSSPMLLEVLQGVPRSPRQLRAVNRHVARIGERDGILVSYRARKDPDLVLS